MNQPTQPIQQPQPQSNSFYTAMGGSAVGVLIAFGLLFLCCMGVCFICLLTGLLVPAGTTNVPDVPFNLNSLENFQNIQLN